MHSGEVTKCNTHANSKHTPSVRAVCMPTFVNVQLETCLMVSTSDCYINTVIEESSQEALMILHMQL
jgi:hypothetical protein